MPKKTVMLLFVSILFASSSAFSFQFRDYHQGDTLTGAEQESIKSSHQVNVKKWLMILGAFSAPAFLYLILLGISGGGSFLPESLENILTKASAAILIITVFLFLYYMTEKAIFIVMVFVSLGFILYAIIGIPVYRRLHREYIKRYGRPTSEDTWICRNCGAENENVYAECQSCGAKSSLRYEESPSEDTWVCSECGWKNPVSDKNCNKCGYRVKGD